MNKKKMLLKVTQPLLLPLVSGLMTTTCYRWDNLIMCKRLTCLRRLRRSPLVLVSPRQFARTSKVRALLLLQSSVSRTRIQGLVVLFLGLARSPKKDPRTSAARVAMRGRWREAIGQEAQVGCKRLLMH